MEYGILDFLTLIGALVLFLFGMKLMSEALQKVAGHNLRKILAAMTSNRVFGVLTGVMITAIIQSSSATTVMVVGVRVHFIIEFFINKDFSFTLL